mgnify:CR=1 FL=1
MPSIRIAGSYFAAAAMVALTAGGALSLGSRTAFAGTAPACIVRGARGPNYIQIINKCSRPERVVVRIKFGPDTDCITIPVGRYHWFRWHLGGYRKTAICG